MFSKLLSILQLVLSLVDNLVNWSKERSLKEQGIREAELEQLRLIEQQKEIANEIDAADTPADKCDILSGLRK